MSGKGTQKMDKPILNRTLYCAITTETHECIKGCPIFVSDKSKKVKAAYIAENNHTGKIVLTEIDPETLNQHMEWVDKNGYDIWENDAIQVDEQLYRVRWDEVGLKFIEVPIRIHKGLDTVDLEDLLYKEIKIVQYPSLKLTSEYVKTEQLIDEVEQLNKQAKNDEDADVILAEFLEGHDYELSGFAEKVFNTYRQSNDKSAVYQMFHTFTGVELDEYLEICKMEITT